MLFAPSLGLLTDSKRHFKHGKDSLSLLDSSVKRGHKGNHVAAAAAGAPAAARISEGLQRHRPRHRAHVPHPRQECSLQSGTHGSIAHSTEHPLWIAAGLATAVASRLNPAQIYKIEKPFPCCFVKLRTARHSSNPTFFS